jgi:hypothetical protein
MKEGSNDGVSLLPHPVLERFGQVGGLNALAASQVGNRAAELQLTTKLMVFGVSHAQIACEPFFSHSSRMVTAVPPNRYAGYSVLI